MLVYWRGSETNGKDRGRKNGEKSPVASIDWHRPFQNEFQVCLSILPISHILYMSACIYLVLFIYIYIYILYRDMYLCLFKHVLIHIYIIIIETQMLFIYIYIGSSILWLYIIRCTYVLFIFIILVCAQDGNHHSQVANPNRAKALGECLQWPALRRPPLPPEPSLNGYIAIDICKEWWTSICICL